MFKEDSKNIFQNSQTVVTMSNKKDYSLCVYWDIWMDDPSEELT